MDLYLTTLLYKLECELSLQSKESNDTLLYIAKIKLDNGSITESDYIQIDIQSLDTKYHYAHAVKSYNASLQRLLTFLKIENENIVITTPYFNLPNIIDVQEVMYFSDKNNTFVSDQKLKQLEAERNLHSTKLQNSFNGDVSLSYGTNQFSEIFKQAYSNSNNSQSVMLSLKIPIFQWGINKNNIQIAENNFEVNKLTIDKEINNFENMIIETVSNYNRSVNLWFLTEERYKLSQKQYNMLVHKFTLGKVAIYELITAQKTQNVTMQQYYSTIKDAYINYFSLCHMTLYDFKNKEEFEDTFVKNL